MITKLLGGNSFTIKGEALVGIKELKDIPKLPYPVKGTLTLVYCTPRDGLRYQIIGPYQLRGLSELLRKGRFTIEDYRSVKRQQIIKLKNCVLQYIEGYGCTRFLSTLDPKTCSTEDLKERVKRFDRHNFSTQDSL